MAKPDDGAGVIDLSAAGTTEAQLVGFRVNSAELHLLHKIWLNDNVVPVLEAGGGAVMIGYASRTGSVTHNLNLSAARASKVAAYVRNKAAGRGTISLPGSRTLTTMNFNAGEAAAAAAGMKDGTESSYYRSVHVRAWRKPAPPPPPLPKQPAPAKNVVVYRQWQKSQLNTPNEPGDTAAELGQALGEFLSPDYGTREYRTYPSDYVVNQVRDEFTVDWEMIAGGSETTYTREISYTWGPREEKILFLKRTRDQRGHWRISERGYFSRSEIWNRTVSPEANVAGI